MLARNLWMALIAGPEMEENTWMIIKEHTHRDDDSLQAIKDIYYQNMKPVVSADQLADLRQRYRKREIG